MARTPNREFCLVRVQDHTTVAEHIPASLGKTPRRQSCEEFYIDGASLLTVELFARVLKLLHGGFEFSRYKKIVGLKGNGNVIHGDSETLLDAQRVSSLEF